MRSGIRKTVYRVPGRDISLPFVQSLAEGRPAEPTSAPKRGPKPAAIPGAPQPGRVQSIRNHNTVERIILRIEREGV